MGKDIEQSTAVIVSGEVMCDATACACVCSLPADGHQTHHCMNGGPFGICDSQWRGVYDEERPELFEIVRFPLSSK